MAQYNRNAHVIHYSYMYMVCCEQDLWRFDINTNVWEQLSLKGAPSPRSGHRMVLPRLIIHVLFMTAVLGFCVCELVH